MPIYEFECTKHGRFELIFSLREFDAIKDGVSCALNKDCKLLAEKAWSLPVYPSHGKPTIIFKNKKTGETEVALYENQETPHGFVKEELRTPYERSKFEKEQQAQQNLEDEYKTEERRFNVDYVRKQRHDDINAKLDTITKDAENPTAAKALLKEAMKRSRNKKVPRKRTDIKLDINHIDKSNLVKG